MTPASAGNAEEAKAAFVIKKVDATNTPVRILPNGSEVIDLAASQILNDPNEVVRLQAYAGGWDIL